MQFRILGPLEVSSENGSLPLGGPNQRALLAILLLNLNEGVRRERLIEEIWEDTPPRTADVSLNGYISKLRKLLTNGSGAVLETRPDGYALVLQPEQLDVTQFEQLVAAAREARGKERLHEAVDLLADALALWRGRPLADLEYASFAQLEIGRLEELRRGAVEDSLELQIDLGRHADVVSELEGLVADNPLRERPVGLLMLALYRSGRQAEALNTYDAIRRRLAEELGLEPGPRLQELQRQMLQHEPELSAVEDGGERRPTERVSRFRAWKLLVPVAAGAGALALLLGFVVPGSGGGTAVAANSLAVLDPSKNAFVGDIPLGKAPSSVAYAFGSAWAVNQHGHVLSRVDPHSLRLEDNISLPTSAEGLAAAHGRLWVAAPLRGGIFQVNPVYNHLVGGAVNACRGCGAALAAGAGALWTTNGFTGLVRIRPVSLAVRHAPVELVRGAHGVAVGAGAVWVAGDGVTRIDPATLLPAGVPVPVGQVSAIAVGARAVWAAVGHKVVKIDPANDSVEASIPVGSNPKSIAYGYGAVWVANSSDGTISRIDPAKEAVVKTIRVGRSPVGLAYGAGRLWVSVQ
jgi:YVTN family beta-propeller protein